MKIKRFFAADIRQALRQVRETLGSDAVILSNKSVDGGVELVAAMDYDESAFDTLTSTTAPADIPKVTELRSANPESTEREPQPAEPSRQTRIEWSQDPVLVEMRQEMKALRQMMENELSGLSWKELGERRPQTQELYRRLMGLGLSPDICRQLVDQAEDAESPDQAWRRSLYFLATSLNTTGDTLLEQGGVVALVGPTGVGKTTTVAKLAARFALKHGHRHVALLSTDNYRIGAQDQLNTFARILDVPVRVAGTPEELSAALNGLADKRLVLVDTAGMSQRDLRLNEQLAMLDLRGKQVRTMLTLSAVTQQAALEQAIETFGAAQPEACILTKLDEAASLGGTLSALIHKNLPLAFVTDGQKVPEDIHLARAHTLVSKAASHAEGWDSSGNDEYLALAFGGARANAHG